MPYSRTLFDTTVDPDSFETLEVSATPVTTTNPIPGCMVLVVAVGTDIFVDVGINADVEQSKSVVPAGYPIMFGITEYGASVSIKAVGNGTGWVTLYYLQ